MSLHRLSFCLTFIALLALPHICQAEEAKTSAADKAPKQLGVFGGWKAYSYGGDKPVCYMTLPVHFTPAKKGPKRNDAFLMITHRPAENTKDVVSYSAGYVFKSQSDATVALGKKSFDLFTQKDTAWSRDAATDHALANGIRNGSSLKITGTPNGKGATPVSDTINLKGAGAAYDAISKACGYPVEHKQAAPAKKAAKQKPKSKTH